MASTDAATKQFLLRMGNEEHQALRVMSATTGHSMNDLALRALREFLAGVGRDEEFEIAAEKVGARYRAVLDKLGNI
jgi:plasmid stability protein